MRADSQPLRLIKAFFVAGLVFWPTHSTYANNDDIHSQGLTEKKVRLLDVLQSHFENNDFPLFESLEHCQQSCLSRNDQTLSKIIFSFLKAQKRNSATITQAQEALSAFRVLRLTTKENMGSYCAVLFHGHYLSTYLQNRFPQEADLIQRDVASGVRLAQFMTGQPPGFQKLEALLAKPGSLTLSHSSEAKKVSPSTTNNSRPDNPKPEMIEPQKSSLFEIAYGDFEINGIFRIPVKDKNGKVYYRAPKPVVAFLDLSFTEDQNSLPLSSAAQQSIRSRAAGRENKFLLLIGRTGIVAVMPVADFLKNSQTFTIKTP